jgi:transglutaminase-like putative cysteine protease
VTRRPEPVEDSAGFRVAVLVALMVAGCAALQEGVGGPILWAVVLIGYPAAFAIAHATRHHRPPLLRVVVTLVAGVVLVMFLASIAGQPTNGFASLQVPLAEVFIWLMLLHAVDSPGRRGLFITLLAGIVLISVAGVLSISMGIAPFIAVWAVCATTALVVGQRAELAPLPALSRKPPVRSRALLSGATAVGASVLAVMVLGAGLFMIAPVAGTDRTLTFPAQLPRTQAVPILGGLSNPSLGSSDPSQPGQPGQENRSSKSFGYIGFSNQLDTGVRGRPDNTLVMRVRASAPDFWRARSFDIWNGRVWTASRTRPIAIRGGQPLRIPRAPDDGSAVSIVTTEELVQTYYIEQQGPNAIFAAATPTRVYFPDRTAFQLPDGSLRAGVQLDKDSVYTVVSRRRLATADGLRASDPLQVPRNIQQLYASPPVISTRTRALAAQVAATEPTTYDKVLALERWMGASTKYSLDIPPLPQGADAVDRFLFVDRRGFCEQIGTSLVVMLRSLGIPARLAVGYATGERNPFTGLYEVRGKDAHAWAEVYFPGIGWQGFDPTAQVPLGGDSAIEGAGTGAFAYLSSRISVPVWAVPSIALLVAALGLIFLGRLLIRRGRRRRKHVDPSWAATRLDQLDRIGERRGRARAPGETTPEYTRALVRLDPIVGPELHTVARILDADMFSGRSIGTDDRATVDAALSTLDERWRQNKRTNERVLVRA